MTYDKKIARLKSMMWATFAEMVVFTVVWAAGVIMVVWVIGVRSPAWAMAAGFIVGLPARDLSKWARRRVLTRGESE
jgi:hypothetical protein